MPREHTTAAVLRVAGVVLAAIVFVCLRVDRAVCLVDVRRADRVCPRSCHAVRMAGGQQRLGNEHLQQQYGHQNDTHGGDLARGSRLGTHAT